MNTLKIKEAAEYLGVSVYTVRQLVRQKKIKHIKVGGAYLFRVLTLEKWLDSQENDSINNEDGNTERGWLFNGKV